MDKVQQDIERMTKEFANLIARKLPVAAGKIAKQHFQDNFRQVAVLAVSKKATHNCMAV